MKEIVQISGSHLKSLKFSLYLKFAKMDENPSIRGKVKISWWGRVTMDSKLKNCGNNIEPWGNPQWNTLREDSYPRKQVVA